MSNASGYPRSGNSFTRAIGRLVLAAARFRIAGELPDLPKFVVCVAPHTSNWDFVVGYAAKLAVGVRASWLGKHSLFRGPVGQLLRAMGGIAVNRSASHGVVAQAVRRFAERPSLVLGIAPEGTRRKVERWRSGFYHIAHQARVPIIPVGLDWGRRTIRIGDQFSPTGNEAEDFRTLYRFFADVRGKVPKNAFPPAGMLMWCLVLLLACGGRATAQVPDTAWRAFHLVLGDWVAEQGAGEPGSASGGGESIHAALGGRILERRYWSEYPAQADRPAFRNEGVMIVYPEGAATRAIAFDNEGHVIRYTATASDTAVVFVSEPVPGSPRFRLTYAPLPAGRISIRFELASPLQPEAFRTYVVGTARRR